MKINKIVQSLLILMTLTCSSVTFAVDLSSLFPTLKRVGLRDFQHIDPAVCFDAACQQIVEAMCLRLVRQDQTGVIVPDLAKAVPSVAAGTIVNNSNGTVTYKFDIQKGYIFSYPSFAPVTGMTVKKTMERAANPAVAIYGGLTVETNYIQDIVGIDKVINGSRPDITGIVVSPDKSKVSITLNGPSGDFLQRLSLSYSCVVPDNTPVTELTKPYPTAGSYTILSYPSMTPDSLGNTHSGMVLVRHLLYPFWLSSEPAGQFFFVSYTFGVTSADQYPAVLAGTYDLGGYPDAKLLDLITNHPGNTKAIPSISTDFFSLNASRWPFCDRHARRAVNFALNRNDFNAFFNGAAATAAFRTSDTMLPPAMPGANPTNGSVYPLDGSGLSSALSEMAAFRAAPSASCAAPSSWNATGPVPIKYIGSTDTPESIAESNYIKAAFDAVGFNTTIVGIVGPTFVYIGNIPADYDISPTGWVFDYNDPFDFLNILLGQGSAYNYGQYFNPVLSPDLVTASLLSPPARFAFTEPGYGYLNIQLAQDGAALITGNPIENFLFSSRIDPNSIGPYPGIIIRYMRLK